MIELFKYDGHRKISSFYIKVSTGTKIDRIIDIINYENRKILKISIKERPIEGKANKAIIEFLSSALKIPKMNFQIKSGLKSKIKQIIVTDFNLTYLNSEIDEHSIIDS